MRVEFLHYSDFQSDDNDLEKTLHCHRKWNFGYVQRIRKLTQTHTHRFSIYAIVISQTILCEGCNSNMSPLFLKEIDAVQPKHSLHLQIFISFINHHYLFMYSLHYVFNLRNGLVQLLTQNFKSCLTSKCIVTMTRYCFSETSSLDMDDSSLQSM